LYGGSGLKARFLTDFVGGVSDRVIGMPVLAERSAKSNNPLFIEPPTGLL